MMPEWGNILIVVLVEMALIAFSGHYAIKLKHYRPSTTHAFLCGLGLGLATLLWYWIAILLPVMLLALFGAFKVYSRKIFWNIIFGFCTPIWLYLPYFLYQVIINFEQ